MNKSEYPVSVQRKKEKIASRESLLRRDAFIVIKIRMPALLVKVKVGMNN